MLESIKSMSTVKILSPKEAMAIQGGKLMCGDPRCLPTYICNNLNQCVPPPIGE